MYPVTNLPQPTSQMTTSSRHMIPIETPARVDT